MSSEPTKTYTTMECVKVWDDAARHGVDLERASVVLWLRKEAQAAAQTYNLQAMVWAKRIDGMADAIKRGAHEVDSE